MVISRRESAWVGSGLGSQDLVLKDNGFGHLGFHFWIIHVLAQRFPRFRRFVVCLSTRLLFRFLEVLRAEEPPLRNTTLGA